jgi:hypothetical protein
MFNECSLTAATGEPHATGDVIRHLVSTAGHLLLQVLARPEEELRSNVEARPITSRWRITIDTRLSSSPLQEKETLEGCKMYSIGPEKKHVTFGEIEMSHYGAV